MSRFDQEKHRSLMFTISRSFNTALTGLALLAATTLRANNIQVTNAAIAGNDNAQGFCFVQFDVTWQNSWRLNGVVNWDAAWVFVKFRSPNGNWQHALLGNTGHTAPVGSQIDVGLLTPGSAFNATTNPVIGTFIRRGTDGTGTFSATGVQLRWNYAQQGIGFNDLAEVRVFGIEMVHVNQGAFFVGSGGTEQLSFTDGSWVSGNSIPYRITSQNAIPIAQTAGSLWGFSNGAGTSGTLPAAFPKGFAAFYCMKYELTQQGYVDFLNTLSYSQQVSRTVTAPNSSAGTGALNSTNAARNGIDIQTPGVASTTPAVYACNLNGNTVYGEATDGKDIVCNYVTWGDLAAYLDWSGLRPMTELEYEKACRGTGVPVPDEGVWGTTTVAASPYTLVNAGSSDEGILTNYSITAGNAALGSTINNGIGGPLRVGIFAANGSNSGRMTAGATYYGIMNMGDNVLEQLVSVDDPEGRVYTGAHGNGALAGDGNPDAADWPSAITRIGVHLRGGYWTNSLFIRLSFRFGGLGADQLRNDSGGRGVRLAP